MNEEELMFWSRAYMAALGNSVLVDHFRPAREVAELVANLADWSVEQLRARSRQTDEAGPNVDIGQPKAAEFSGEQFLGEAGMEEG